MSAEPRAPEDALFRCPETGAPLAREPEGYRSPAGKLWPLLRGIPRFVASDAYVGSFSFEWNTHTQTQLDSSNAGRARSTELLHDKTGLTREQVAGKLVLDAGVGAGRFSEVLGEWGARVVGVDLSYAVESASRNLARFPQVRVAQADIFQLPFAPETFDFIVSIGVLHHTPDTRRAFAALVPLLKPGGELCVWVYPREGDFLVRDEWIPFTRRIPNRLFYRFCRRLLPLVSERPGHPLVTYLKSVFPFSDQGMGLENDILDTFDGFSPQFHGIHTPAEVRAWFAEEGLVDVVSQPEWGTAVRGRKPLAAPERRGEEA